MNWKLSSFCENKEFIQNLLSENLKALINVVVYRMY
jgi:hypothetical protein